MARILKQQIRNVIKEHFGEDIEIYAQKAGDGQKLMNAFINALSRAIKPGSVPPTDCTCELINFDGHPSPIDIEIGLRIQTLRIQHVMSREELATRMEVHQDYLAELEQGKLTPTIEIYDTVAHALGSPDAATYLMQDLDEQTETEAWVRYAIAKYFGRSLWTFRPDVSYNDLVDPFVKALAGLGQTGQHALKPSPSLPTLGYMVEAEDKKRKIVLNPSSASLVRTAFETMSSTNTEALGAVLKGGRK